MNIFFILFDLVDTINPHGEHYFDIAFISADEIVRK